MKYIHASSVPSPAGHYSHAVEQSDTVYLSGVLPATAPPQGGMPSFAAQVEMCFGHCEAILAEAGCTLGDVVSCTIYITDIALWPQCNALYAQRFGQHKPARAVVPVPCLHHGYALEVQMVAVKGAGEAKG